MNFFGDYRTLRFTQTKKGRAWDTPDEQNLPNLKLNIKATTFKC